MSRTLHLTCIDCNKTLWVGQHSNSRGWFLYGTEADTKARDTFVNDHIGHTMKFQDHESVDWDAEDVTDYGEEQ